MPYCSGSVHCATFFVCRGGTIDAEISATVRRRPAVHRLTYGAFLQGHVWIDPQSLVLPLAPMGFQRPATYACDYQRQLLGIEAQPTAVEGLIAQGHDPLPVLAFINFTTEERSPAAMEAEALPKLSAAEQLVSWISGDLLHDFALVIAATDQIYIRTTPPSSRRRLLLGPGNVGEALQKNVDSIRDLSSNDERFAFALSLYRDALHEGNAQFKIARLFGVLEALAYALKGDGVGSRDAVRRMLRLESGAMGEVAHGGRTIRFERITLARRLRKLFHGAPFRREDLPADHRDSFDLITQLPNVLVSALMSDCELEFARWGNNASVARTAAEARPEN